MIDVSKMIDAIAHMSRMEFDMHAAARVLVRQGRCVGPATRQGRGTAKEICRQQEIPDSATEGSRPPRAIPSSPQSRRCSLSRKPQTALRKIWTRRWRFPSLDDLRHCCTALGADPCRCDCGQLRQSAVAVFSSDFVNSRAARGVRNCERN